MGAPAMYCCCMYISASGVSIACCGPWWMKRAACCCCWYVSASMSIDGCLPIIRGDIICCGTGTGTGTTYGDAGSAAMPGLPTTTGTATGAAAGADGTYALAETLNLIGFFAGAASAGLATVSSAVAGAAAAFAGAAVAGTSAFAAVLAVAAVADSAAVGEALAVGDAAATGEAAAAGERWLLAMLALNLCESRSKSCLSSSALLRRAFDSLSCSLFTNLSMACCTLSVAWPRLSAALRCCGGTYAFAERRCTAPNAISSSAPCAVSGSSKLASSRPRPFDLLSISCAIRAASRSRLAKSGALLSICVV
eukprot:Unigene6056_Nuclearia_a/m.18558 Unigene6056_Nuclearia_a/g.18558  ORF Unigene6056_Nuclearia_a/g.18558 Unigene6056_Nuclearia_a/m.18558 type:complete len:309 (-) Unigene6056_Nuclearia_a:565-1491(-)